MDLFNSAGFPSHVDDLMKEHHVPGLAIAIVQNDTIMSAGYGQASLSPSTPCTPDTLFDIASASKSMTAASVGLLVDNNDEYPEVQYDATMSNLLPDDFVMSEEQHTKGITVEDILSHRTGMAPHDLSYLGPRASEPDNARSVTRNLRNLAVAASIRSKYMYCNMMYTVATHLVESKTGISFSDFLEKYFFRPLNMHSTSLQPERARVKGFSDRIATGYSYKEEQNIYHGFQTPDCPEAQGAGSIITSVNDYIKWVKAVMNQDNPITDSVYKGLIKARTLQNPDFEDLAPMTSPVSYAAGWEIFFYRGYMVVGHDGAVPGFGSRHFFLPDFRFGGVILGNSEGAGVVAAVVAREFIDDVLNVPKPERPDWNEIEREDHPSSSEEYEKLRQRICPGIEDSEPQELPLSAYVGDYWNPGYRKMTLQTVDKSLFINAPDRSFSSTLTLDHVCRQTHYIAHLIDDLEGSDEPVKVEFVLENEVAVRMGLHLEPELKQMIWFDRVTGIPN
ncbi:beta-lactamase family protein [Aspergillus candidus]|uniref:Beta-lactamase family protein n=1 Tax=Aspergillus candidus TaxID=41067 RepID=A0A2I2FML3_ASPCN|nr:beta-lactamase family protein [Aspergillus candidus]PLB41875.1 beta-lactamase family protein [Aspergillus candidus]